MAVLIPSINSTRFDTNGERRLARRLEEKLDDEYGLWHDVPIGRKQLRPDFIVLHPLRGILVLEVKDWSVENIVQANPNQFTVNYFSVTKKVTNPLKQARTYVMEIVKLLERDARLVHPIGHKHQGKLTFPYGYGAVLTNITRKDFDKHELGQVLEPHLVICKDEMTKSIDVEVFQKRLWDMFAYSFSAYMTEEHIKRIRWHIFPDITIDAEQLKLSLPKERGEIKPRNIPIDLIKIMDIQQEQLARSLGDGHRVIHGVAGSGKTLILAYRCQFLAKANMQKILVLCFNVALATKLRHVMQEKMIDDVVNVRHFHGWCMEQLRIHHLPFPDSKQLTKDEYVDRLVNKVIEATNEGIIPTGRYDAVMIDEGHDFQPEWFKLLTQMVNPETESVLLLYDDAQNLYGKTKQRKFTFKSVGIEAQGRTKILSINYRNTAEILALAYEFVKEAISLTDFDEDMPICVKPESAQRHGIPPELIKLPRFNDEAGYLGDRLHELNQEGIPWNDMAILYRYKFMAEEISKQLSQLDVPVEWVNRDKQSRFYNPDQNSVKLLTMHSSKGLEFPIVFIPGLGFMPGTHGDPTEEARLLYVAMTRSTDRLFLTCHDGLAGAFEQKVTVLNQAGAEKLIA
jgi:hypothetical protein